MKNQGSDFGAVDDCYVGTHGVDGASRQCFPTIQRFADGQSKPGVEHNTCSTCGALGRL